jgi:hypothetical protein
MVDENQVQKASQSRSEQVRASQSKSEQVGASWSKLEQVKASQSKSKEVRASQSKSKQVKYCVDLEHCLRCLHLAPAHLVLTALPALSTRVAHSPMALLATGCS